MGVALTERGRGFKNFRRAMRADNNIAKKNPPYENPRSATDTCKQSESTAEYRFHA